MSPPAPIVRAHRTARSVSSPSTVSGGTPTDARSPLIRVTRSAAAGPRATSSEAATGSGAATGSSGGGDTTGGAGADGGDGVGSATGRGGATKRTRGGPDANRPVTSPSTV